MNVAGSIVDNFIMLRFLHPQELIFGHSTIQKKDKLTPKTGYLLTCTVMIQELGGALQNFFTHRALPQYRGSHFEKSTVKGGKRRRGILIQGFSGHTDWNEKRGIRLKTLIFFGNFPIE